MSTGKRPLKRNVPNEVALREIAERLSSDAAENVAPVRAQRDCVALQAYAAPN